MSRLKIVNHLQGCECSDERLTAQEFALCAAESTCRMHCQGPANRMATGVCNGWKCECKSNTQITFPDNLDAEYVDSGL